MKKSMKFTLSINLNLISEDSLILVDLENDNISI